jgi:hypothetical protein
MFFNFFRNAKMMSESFRKEEYNTQDEQTLAKITYSFIKDNPSTMVDIEIQEYNEESINALAHIVSTIGEENIYLDTLEIIENAMIKNNKENYFFKLIAELSKNTRLHNGNTNELDNPCIKPSDML